MSSHASDYKPCNRCGKVRVARQDRRNYCVECRDDTLRPIANWMEHGACRNPAYNPEWWWPESGDTAKGNTPIAVNICGTCDVRDLCLDYALQHKEREGIWGGLLPAARNALGASLRYRKKVS